MILQAAGELLKRKLKSSNTGVTYTSLYSGKDQGREKTRNTPESLNLQRSSGKLGYISEINSQEKSIRAHRN